MLEKIKNKLNGEVHFKDLLKGSAITFVLKISGIGSSYVLIYLIAKRLGAEGVGFFQVMLQILTILGMVLGLGMNISVLRYVGQFNNEENRPKMHALYKYFLQTVAPLSFCVGILLYFGANYIVHWIGKDEEYAEGLKLIGIVLPFFTINQISVEFIRGLKKLQISELVRSVLSPLVMILGISVLFRQIQTKVDIIYLLVFSLIINSMVSRWAIWKTLKKVTKNTFGFERKEFMKTSYPMLLTAVCSSLLAAMPFFFLDYYTTQADVGVYSVAFRLALIPSLVLKVINIIAAPKFSELYWAEKMQELQKLITQSTKLMFWAALGLVIIIVFFGKYDLQVFGEKFQEGYLVLLILSLGQLVNAATGSVGVVMNMSGKQKDLRRVITILTVIGFCSYLTLGTWFKVSYFYIAIVSAVIDAVLNIYLSSLVFKKYKIKTYYIPL